MTREDWKPIIELISQAPIDKLRGMYYLTKDKAWVASNGYAVIYIPVNLSSKPVKSDCFIPLDKLLRLVTFKRRDEVIDDGDLFKISQESTWEYPSLGVITKDTKRTETLLTNSLVGLILRALSGLVGDGVKLESYQVGGQPALKFSSVSGEGAYAYVMGCALKEEYGKEA